MLASLATPNHAFILDLLKTPATVSGLTMPSHITGLIRETLIARAFDVSVYTDTFSVAFRIPNLPHRLSAEGAFSQTLVPILDGFKNRQGEAEIRALVDSVATVMTWFLVIISALGVIDAPLIVTAIATGSREHESQAYISAIFMMCVMFPYIGLVPLVASASGILNTRRRFAVPAFTPMLLNLSFVVAAVFVAPHLRTPIYVQAYAVMVGGTPQLTIQIPSLRKVGILPRMSINVRAAQHHPGVQRVLEQMSLAMLSVSVAQISLIINTNIASRSPMGNVSWLNYTDRLMEFPTALLGVTLGAILLPSLSKASADNNHEEYSSLLDWGLRPTVLFAMPPAVGLSVFDAPLVATLFHYGKFSGMDVEMTRQALTSCGIGLIGLIVIKILVPGFYARQDIRTPIKIALVVLVATQLSNYVFMPAFGHAELALSISFGATINTTLLFFGLRWHGYYRPLPSWGLFIAQVISAALLLAGTLLWLAHSSDWVGLGAKPLVRAVLLGVSLVLCTIVYFGTLWLTGLKFSTSRKKAI